RHRPTAGTAVVGLLGLVGAAAALSRPDTAGVAAALPSLAGAGAGAVALRALVSRLPASDRARSSAGPVPSEPSAASGPDRRSFLTASAVVGAGAALSAAAGSVLGRAGRAATTARRTLRLPAAARPAPPVPSGAQVTVAGVADVVTANADF